MNISKASRSAAALLLAAGLAGCGTLPHDGPSSRSAPRDAAREGARYALVDLTYAATQMIAAHPAPALAGLLNESSTARSDLIAAGDRLTVSVFEPGVNGLFSTVMSAAAQGGPAPPTVSIPALSPGAQAPVNGVSSQALPLVVGSDGFLRVPFADKVRVAGLTPEQAATAIQQALRGRAVDPQVTVAVVSSRASSVSVVGEVRTPGRFQLAPYNDRLLDLLAEAGGPAKSVPDLAIMVYRGDKSAEAPLSLLMSDPAQNIRLAPEDRILLLHRPRKYSTFGAFLKNDQIAMEDDRLTLADAISKAGGLDTRSADGASVLLFRFERPEVAQALGVTLPPTAKGVPVIYRLNFLKPESMFVAGSFNMEPSDLLYVSRSDITEIKKFFDLVNSVTQIGYNVRITTGLDVP